MQPLYKPQSQPQTLQKSEPVSIRELEETLACSLARVVQRETSFTVVDTITGKAYRVTVQDHPFPSDTAAGVLYMKAGPAGETCKCCNGSGVEG